MQRTWLRRTLMVSCVIFSAVSLTLLVPLWFPLLLVVDVVRRKWRFPLCRFTSFGLLWTWMETAGVIGAFSFWIAGRGRDQDLNYRLQAWWTRGVLASLRRTVGLKINVEGAPQPGGGPYVAFCRHASLADSLMSAWVFITHCNLKPRYVLKRELKMDPCLDIVGHRLPNYFVDRNSSNLSVELLGIEQVAIALDVGDIAVIFPEGTRANSQKRTSGLALLRERSPERFERLENLKYLLPPKSLGASALLSAVPNATVLTMWHSGFDGMDTFKGIVRQLAKSAIQVQVKIVAHQRSTVATGEAFIAWLDTQWALMDESVARHLSETNIVHNNGGNNG